jgi:hypothetical protein
MNAKALPPPSTGTSTSTAAATFDDVADDVMDTIVALVAVDPASLSAFARTSKRFAVLASTSIPLVIKERVGRHELPYDPMRRYAKMARAMGPRLPRGAKPTEHLEVLRISNPSYGSLRPTERVHKHEQPYDPVLRFAALAKTLREPRGTKSLTHLANLRRSDPCRVDLARGRGTTTAPEVEEAPPTVHQLAKPTSVCGRLPRILSAQALDELDETASLLSEALTEAQTARAPRHSRTERWSNNTINSFLDDVGVSPASSVPSSPYTSPSSSGEWLALEMETLLNLPPPSQALRVTRQQLP